MSHSTVCAPNVCLLINYVDDISGNRNVLVYSSNVSYLIVVSYSCILSHEDSIFVSSRFSEHTSTVWFIRQVDALIAYQVAAQAGYIYSPHVLL